MKPCSNWPIILLCGCWASVSGPAMGGGAVDFVREVRPIFKQHCYSCHGETKQKNGYRLDVKSVALEGGEGHAPNIVSGNAQGSPLIKFVTGRDKEMVMPKKGGKLSGQEIAILKNWINQGAVWPDGVDLVSLKDVRDHWSFKPLAKQDTSRDIDSYIRESLKRSGLSMSPEADKISWLRRVYFNLIGMPPSPDKVRTFLADNTLEARARVVDELLKSPRYGEHWAQHWLDVVRYADTHGYEVNTSRPNAWPYRDYVIKAFNTDRPYDQFIMDQIAGDLTGQDAATGFLVTPAVLLPGQIGKDAASKRLARQDELDEIIINTSDSFLGLSVGCARCHNHKFDPISAKDYYSFQAFFAGVRHGDRAVKSGTSRNKARQRLLVIDKLLARFVPLANADPQVTRLPVRGKMNIDRFSPVKTKRVRFSIVATNKYEPCIDELEVYDTAGNNIALASKGTKATFSGSSVVAGRHEPLYVNDGLYGNSKSWMSNTVGKGWVDLEFAKETSIERVVWGRDRQGVFADRLAINYTVEIQNMDGGWAIVASSNDREAYRGKANTVPPLSLESLPPVSRDEIAALLEERKPIAAQVRSNVDTTLVYAGIFGKPHDVHKLYRGDAEQPKEKVSPAVLSLFGGKAMPATASDSDRRRTLAGWIAHTENPLTARVMVNRIWQWHFGMGLVETANDFGNSGTAPSHPELLDWLAAEFIRSGWSIKHLQRLITLSDCYAQSSKVNPKGSAKDSGVRLLWRFPSKRIDAESIRDTMLACSGRLNLTMGGPGFSLFKSRGGLSGFPPLDTFTHSGRRRMIYAHKIRMEKDIVFGGFDHPDGGQSAARRPQSTTPIQALNLFNSRFTMEEAAAFAERLKREAGDSPVDQIKLAYLIAYSRQPAASEISLAESFVAKHGLAALCRVIYNSNEFIFIP